MEVQERVSPVGPVTSSLPVHSDPEIVSGTPVFIGTRVPVESLFEFLEAGDSLDRFLDDFLSVSRDQAVAVLETARAMVLQAAHAPAALKSHADEVGSRRTDSPVIHPRLPTP